MKKNIAMLLMLSLLFSPALANEKMNGLKKEIRILKKVIATAFDAEKESNKKLLQPQDINGTYLEGQGVILYFDVGMSGLFSMGEIEFNFFHQDSLDSIAENVASIDWGELVNKGIKEEDRENLESITSEATALSATIMDSLFSTIDDFTVEDQNYKVELSKLKEEQQKLIKEIQQKAELARKEYQNNWEKNESKQRELEEAFSSLVENAKVNTHRYKEKAEKVRDKHFVQWQNRLDEFETVLFDILCEYGASLRSLPGNERVSVIINRGVRTPEGAEDKILVFKKADLIACRNGDMKVKELIERSSKYSF